MHVAFTIIIALLGLAVGSFLNVLIGRLPIMLENSAQAQCAEFLNKPHPKIKRFNLAWPGSHCPSCEHSLVWWMNIPLISFMVLRARCHFCKASIGWRYPVVELLSMLLALGLFCHFGMTVAFGASLIFTWGLIALFFIDLDTMILPDEVTLGLLWIGLLVNVSGTFVSLQSAVIGAVAGYVFFYAVFWLFKWVTKKEGLGYGDFKLFAACGAWLGWQMLPVLVIVSGVLTLLFALIATVAKRYQAGQQVPFGPGLTVAAFVVLIWGTQLTNVIGRLG
jgi:leader peptidase (prepilin peptidase) / N-methyltransferase